MISCKANAVDSDEAQDAARARARSTRHTTVQDETHNNPKQRARAHTQGWGRALEDAEKERGERATEKRECGRKGRSGKRKTVGKGRV